MYDFGEYSKKMTVKGRAFSIFLWRHAGECPVFPLKIPLLHPRRIQVSSFLFAVRCTIWLPFIAAKARVAS
jgi:hypothetical protein